MEAKDLLNCKIVQLTSSHQAQVLDLRLSMHEVPGRDLEPGLGVRPRALITSTSSWPFLSINPI